MRHLFGYAEVDFEAVLVEAGCGSECVKQRTVRQCRDLSSCIVVLPGGANRR